MFQTTEYKAFERSVHAALATTVEEDPHSIIIQKAFPALNDRLRTMVRVIQNGQVSHSQALYSLEILVARRVGQLTTALDDFIGGSFTCQFTPRSQGQPGSRALPFTGAAVGPLAPAPLPLTALAQAAASLPGQYCMSRTVQTIPELWREWTVGLHGQPSIERLDELYGAGWRSGPTKAAERQFYSRRKVLITEIKRLAAVQGESFDAVIAVLEEERKRAGASLSKVIDTLK